MLMTAGVGQVPITSAALLGALIMILSGALKIIEEGYQSIEWKAIVMVGGHAFARNCFVDEWCGRPDCP
jgi:hypothetical protein